MASFILKRVWYLDGVPEDGMAKETSVTDLKGKTVLSVRAERKGNQIFASAEPAAGQYPFSFEVLGDEKLEILTEERK